LKSKFGMYDPRTAPNAAPEAMACRGNDFLQRVGSDRAILGRGRMVSGEGTAPVQPTAQPSALEQAISKLTPQQYSEDDIEQLVQVITDQIMHAAL